MVRVFILIGLIAAIAAPAAAQPKIMPPTGQSRSQRCDALLQPAGFDNRYEMIGGMTKATACMMRGLIDEDRFTADMQPRIRLYLDLCYSIDEQPYLRNVVQRGIVQAMPYISQAGCDSVFARVLEIKAPGVGASTTP